MPAKRKTIDVARIRDMANSSLANSREEYRESREGVASLLESVLMETGNYNGFQFIDGTNGETDRTRRKYY